MMYLRFVAISILLCWIACSPPKESVESSIDFDTCEAALMQAWQADTLELHHDSTLADLLPRRFGKTRVGPRSGATYIGRKRGFSETEVIFRPETGESIRYQLRDYAQDTVALLALWQEFKVAGKGESPHPFAKRISQLGGCDQVFAWRWQDQRNGFLQIEAVLYHRYHLTLSSDYKDTDEALQKAWDAMPWKKWDVLGVEPIDWDLGILSAGSEETP